MVTIQKILKYMGFISEAVLYSTSDPSSVLADIDSFLRSGGRDTTLNRSFNGLLLDTSFLLRRRNIFEDSAIKGTVVPATSGAAVSIVTSCGEDVARFVMLFPFAGVLAIPLGIIRSRPITVAEFLFLTVGGIACAGFFLLLGGSRGRTFNRENLDALRRVVPNLVAV